MKKKKRRLPKSLRIISKLAIGIVGLLFIGLVGIYLTSFLLGPPSLTNELNTVYYDHTGEVIGKEKGVENRQWIELDEMSPDVINATLITEDQHFYDHHGFDYKRIAGAVLKNIQSQSLSEGASTLTQQLARNLFLSHEKTWDRKIKEAFYTVRLEMYYSKEEILEGYLNTIYYGHGAYGIEAASNYFFNKSASELDLAEASMLTGIPKGPTYYSPLNDEDNAENRQTQILHLMLGADMITEKEFEIANEQELVYIEQQEKKEKTIGPYFQDIALREASQILDMDMESLRSSGYEIHTTLDKELQKQLEDSIDHTMNSSTELEVGALSLDPDSGAIRALVGGRDYAKSPFNRAVDAKRMAGSTFKPFLYYLALENGYTATTMLDSKPTTFELENGEVYQPSNFNDYYAYEPITLAQAIALSDNIYAVKTNMFLSVDKLLDTAKTFGFTSDLPAVPSLALGTASVSVKEMVTAYGMIANGGHTIDGHAIEKIVGPHGKTIFKREKDKGEAVLDPKQTFILTDLMTGMFDPKLNGYTAVTGSTIADELTRTYAGKSGSTNADSWMIGFSPRLVTGVWAGYDDNRPIQLVAETTYAKKIWGSFMESAHEGLPHEGFDTPRGIVAVPIDPATGMRATPYCDVSRIMYFEAGTEPQSNCMEHFHGDQHEHGEEQDPNKGTLEQLFDSLFSW
ncbi:transglycosylase domain-containing protein [Oceanobacillus bengalensis]|uniref:PBP1A family penicillin-binding protein n=1 Tax=Oceanobacillus bengalensis TaxID=1435466 RepID=A0A494YYU7_9BACI|nr:PBP1A family penicillin-binding protein [Oceanobacillus bengalensis]RKQ15400.1 PBP1A family penicillin-binding protein [Oceanobacillus bengalensis]